MITTTAPTISATGISAPTYVDVLAFLQNKFRSIYGADVYLEPDSQDGQFLAIIAQAIHDTNAVAIQIYQSYSPATAQDAALASNVKINGIAKAVATNSSVDLLITGQAGTTITNGIVQDSNGHPWNLPASVIIPPAGQVTVTAIASSMGAIGATAGTVTIIKTPTLGWQSVTNPSDAMPGNPVESDADLRYRQSQSTMLPSRTVLDGIAGAVANIRGVQALVPYENDTGVTDSNGLPPHSISLVVEGGDAAMIAQTIAIKKAPGANTFGTTSETVFDSYGIPKTIHFFRPTAVPVAVVMTIKALAGYNSTIGAAAATAMAAYISGVAIGGGAAASVENDECVVAAKSVVGASTFKIVSLTLSRASGAGTPDVPLAFNEQATCSASSVTVTPT